MGCLLALRWWLVLIGLGVTIYGCEETRIAWRCRSQPEAVTIEELEKGYRPPNDYLSVGSHLAIFEGGVYEEQVPKGQKPSKGENPSARLNYFYYPIVSLHSAAATSAGASRASYSMLVKTTELETMGELQAKIGDGTPLRSAGVSGVVINVIDPLDREERDLLHEAFPQVDLDAVLLLELDRTPKSRASALGVVLLGLVTMLSPAILWLAKRAPKGATSPASLDPVSLPAFTVPPRGQAPAGASTWGSSASQPPPPGVAPAPAPPTMLGYAPPSSYPPNAAPPSGPRPTGAYGSSLPPPPSSAPSLPPTSVRLQPGARVRVTRKTGDVFGTVVKAQAGQVSVNLDDGRTVWVATDVISLA